MKLVCSEHLLSLLYSTATLYIVKYSSCRFMLELANRHYSSGEILLVDVKVTDCAAYCRNCTAYMIYHQLRSAAEVTVSMLSSLLLSSTLFIIGA